MVKIIKLIIFTIQICSAIDFMCSYHPTNTIALLLVPDDNKSPYNRFLKQDINLNFQFLILKKDNSLIRQSL